MGIEILHEDPDIIIGNKAPGFLTVAALWEKENTLQQNLNLYVRKGNPKSKKCVYVVHRLDQATSGILIFAKSVEIQYFLKEHWPTTIKYYYAIVHGKMEKKSGLIESFLQEDDDYVVHSTKDSKKGKLAQTEYTVVQQTEKMSLLKIKLLTGKKNQIRVHMTEAGFPIVGDTKYGAKETKFKKLLLHSFSIEFTHPFKNQRVRFQAPVPDYFNQLMPYKY